MKEIETFHFEGECDDDWMDYDCPTDDPRDSLMLNKQLENEIKATEAYAKQSLDKRVEFLQKEKERVFQDMEDEIVICAHCNEIIDRKCRHPECHYEYMDETHMESDCCFKTNNPDFIIRSVDAATFLKSKHAQHVLDEFFGKSIQKAIVLSFEYFMEDTESPTAFIDMIKKWNEMNQNEPKDGYFSNKTPIMRLLDLMEFYGPGICLESFIRCCVRLHKRSRHIHDSYGFGSSSSNDVYELMRKLQLVKIFGDMNTMDDLMYDCMDYAPRTTQSTQEILKCTSIENLNRVRIRYFAHSPEECKERERLIKEERKQEEKIRIAQEKMRRNRNLSSLAMSYYNNQNHFSSRFNDYNSDDDY